jgi:hypothetical protein
VGQGSRGFTVRFGSQGWENSLLNLFVNRAPFIVRRVVDVAGDTLDMFRFLFTWAEFSEMISCIFSHIWDYGNSRLGYARIADICPIAVGFSLVVVVRIAL